MTDRKDHQEIVSEDNPMGHPEEQPTGGDGTPKFGRLLIVLILMVILIGFITFASEWLYT